MLARRANFHAKSRFLAKWTNRQKMGSNPGWSRLFAFLNLYLKNGMKGEIFEAVKGVLHNFGWSDKVVCYMEISAWRLNNLQFHLQQNQKCLKVTY